MKKSKLLTPLITLSSFATVAIPTISMTSCAKGEIEEQHFTLTSGTQNLEINTPIIAGQTEFVFTSIDSKLTEEAANLIDVYVSITSANNNVNVLRCWKKETSTTNKTITLVVSYSVNPASYEKKASESDKVEFSVILHNGTWIQTITGFSITAIGTQQN